MKDTKELKVGDSIEVVLQQSYRTLKVRGKVKEIKKAFSKNQYLVTQGVVEDFWHRRNE